ncbi:MAG TPA: phenylalanine--tRNA ligase subunit alpha, partial [Acidimicrobiia bacterium]
MDLEQILADASPKIAAASDLMELDRVESETVGRNSPLGEARRQLGQIPAEERPAAGARVNEAQARLSSLITERRLALERQEADRLLETDGVDVSLEALTLPEGT